MGTAGATTLGPVPAPTPDPTTLGPVPAPTPAPTTLGQAMGCDCESSQLPMECYIFCPPTTPDPTTPPPVSLGCGCINKESLICDYETTEPDCYFIDDNTEWSEKCCI